LKLGINTNVYSEYPIQSFIPRISEMGYEGIEIARTHPIHEWGNEELKGLQKKLSEYGIEAYCIQGGTPYTDLAYAKNRIDLAHAIGCPLVNLGPGLGFEKESDRGRVWEESSNAISELIDYARDRGVACMIEPEPRLPLSAKRPLITTYRDALRMLNETKAGDLGVLLDVIHVNVSRESLPHVIKTFGKKIRLVHISDAVDRRNYHFVPGKGDLNFEAFLKMLKRAGYEGFLSVEVYPYFDEPDRAAFESMEYLTNLMYAVESR